MDTVGVCRGFAASQRMRLRHISERFSVFFWACGVIVKLCLEEKPRLIIFPHLLKVNIFFCIFLYIVFWVRETTKQSTSPIWITSYLQINITAP